MCVLKVSTENVTLIINCEEKGVVEVKRDPQELVFDSASSLYIGQAGDMLREPLNVSILHPPPFTTHDTQGTTFRDLCTDIFCFPVSRHCRQQVVNIFDPYESTKNYFLIIFLTFGAELKCVISLL